jgi:drug/metabolite transporter (DMT)-like permease
MGPSRTAVILALEPVFGALTAAVVLNERLSVRGGVGALFILVAIFVVLGKEDAVETEAESISAAH